MIQQLTIFVENKAGRMAEIAQMIADANVDIRALSLADTTSYGILRLIVDKPEAAELALRQKGLTLTLTEVLAVQMDDQPGGFAHVLNVLAKGNCNIEYMYAFIDRQKGRAAVILRAEDNARAEAILTSNGVSLLSQQAVFTA